MKKFNYKPITDLTNNNIFRLDILNTINVIFFINPIYLFDYFNIKNNNIYIFNGINEVRIGKIYSNEKIDFLTENFKYDFLTKIGKHQINFLKNINEKMKYKSDINSLNNSIPFITAKEFKKLEYTIILF